MASESSTFPEGAAEYLSNTNFKTLMEWMTAEVCLGECRVIVASHLSVHVRIRVLATVLNPHAVIPTAM